MPKFSSNSNLMKKILFSSIVVMMFYSPLKAQDFNGGKQSFHAGVSFPNALSNFAFQEIMQGLINLQAHYQYSVLNQLYVGAGLKNNYFTINEFKTPTGVNGGMHIGGPFIKLGYEEYFGRVGFDFGVNTSYNINRVSATNTRYTFDAFAFEPTVGLSLTATEKSSYRLNLSWANYGFVFKPHMLNENKLAGLNPEELTKGSNAFTIGFSYALYF